MAVSSGFITKFLQRRSQGALKLTISQFYRVNGDSTQKEGVRSDIVLPSLLDHMDWGEASLDNALPFDRIRPAEFSKTDFVSSDIIDALNKSSRARVAADPKFQEVLADIKKYKLRKDRQTVSLNEETLKKERNEGKKKDEKADEKDKKKTEKPEDKPIFPEGFYNDELLRIAVEYSELLKKRVATANN